VGLVTAHSSHINKLNAYDTPALAVADYALIVEKLSNYNEHLLSTLRIGFIQEGKCFLIIATFLIILTATYCLLANTNIFCPYINTIRHKEYPETKEDIPI